MAGIGQRQNQRQGQGTLPRPETKVKVELPEYPYEGQGQQQLVRLRGNQAKRQCPYPTASATDHHNWPQLPIKHEVDDVQNELEVAQYGHGPGEGSKQRALPSAHGQGPSQHAALPQGQYGNQGQLTQGEGGTHAQNQRALPQGVWSWSAQTQRLLAEGDFKGQSQRALPQGAWGGQNQPALPQGTWSGQGQNQRALPQGAWSGQGQNQRALPHGAYGGQNPQTARNNDRKLLKEERLSAPEDRPQFFGTHSHVGYSDQYFLTHFAVNETEHQSLTRRSTAHQTSLDPENDFDWSSLGSIKTESTEKTTLDSSTFFRGPAPRGTQQATAGHGLNFYLAPGDELTQCPYYSSHMVRVAKLNTHISKCMRNYKQDRIKDPSKPEFGICSFDYTHHLPLTKLDKHMETCPNRPKDYKPIGEDDGWEPVPVESIGGKKVEKLKVEAEADPMIDFVEVEEDDDETVTGSSVTGGNDDENWDDQYRNPPTKDFDMKEYQKFIRGRIANLPIPPGLSPAERKLHIQKQAEVYQKTKEKADIKARRVQAEQMRIWAENGPIAPVVPVERTRTTRPTFTLPEL